MDQNIMGIAYHTPYSYQSRQYATGIHAYNNEQTGHYNLNQRDRAATDYAEQGLPGDRLMNGAFDNSSTIPEEISSSYPPELRTGHTEIRTTQPDMRSPPLIMPPPPVGYGGNRDKKKGGRFFRRLIRPFRNLIKRPQPSEKFVATSQG
ncbi:hypothetical protein LOD99_13963 [Oopsacas minuta]|uniref:Uncharacterized protein n=1 Tax=Oopsacas minuta TaxID=111878 RepID=A0AAV7KGA8_9METZ|nr:hypothetical protein LOD99_13963 [Oopsacas minuta]